MCAAQDRSATQADMDATFYTTNIVPQSPNCNQRGWERLEAYCRDLTKGGHVLQIVCGPHGQGGTGKDGPKEQIGPSRAEVMVPAKLWKVVLVLPNEDAVPPARTEPKLTGPAHDGTFQRVKGVVCGRDTPPALFYLVACSACFAGTRQTIKRCCRCWWTRD